MSAPALKKIPTLELVFGLLVGPPGLEPGSRSFDCLIPQALLKVTLKKIPTQIWYLGICQDD